MTYIVVSENEIVKAEMGRPVPLPSEFAAPSPAMQSVINNYKAHCLSLPRIPIKGKHKWEVWQSVPESEIRWQYQYCKQDNIYRWFNCEKIDYIGWPKHLRRIVAIPIQPTPEGEKVEETKRVLLLISYCGDEGDGCTSDFPCDDCLKMCNVVTIKESSILENLGGFDYNKFLLNNDNTQTK